MLMVAADLKGLFLSALALLYRGLLVQSRAGLITDRHRAAVSRELARLRARREESR